MVKSDWVLGFWLDRIEDLVTHYYKHYKHNDLLWHTYIKIYKKAFSNMHHYDYKQLQQ